MRSEIILSCEHAGNFIPDPYKPLFADADEALNSHRGWDIGALDLAQGLQKKLKAPLFYTEVTRLLVEANRTVGQPDFFSEFTRELSEEERQYIVAEYYFPYRNEVEEAVQKRISQGAHVLHLSIHSFTPVLNGIRRETDMGLLYDPSRKNEADFCSRLEEAMTRLAPDVIVRHNYPYLGTSDGFTSYLRLRFSEEQYTGVELEINQKFPEGPEKEWTRLKNILIEAIQDSLT